MPKNGIKKIGIKTFSSARSPDPTHETSFSGVTKKTKFCRELPQNISDLKADIRHEAASIWENHFKECSKKMETDFRS